MPDQDTARYPLNALDAEVHLDRSLANGDGLDIVQQVLVEAAPRWTSGLRIWKEARDQRPIDASRAGALRQAVDAAMHRSQFVRRYAWIELRGGTPGTHFHPHPRVAYMYPGLLGM